MLGRQKTNVTSSYWPNLITNVLRKSVREKKDELEKQIKPKVNEISN